MSAFREAAELYQLPNEPDLNVAFRVPGMLSTGTETTELAGDVFKAIMDATSEAVVILNSVREQEGAAIFRPLELGAFVLR